MSEQKQVLHIEPKKGFTVAQSNEHLRNWTEKGWMSANENGRIDRSRQHLNFEIVKGGKVQPINKTMSIPKLIMARLKELGLNDPNEGLAEPRYRTTADFIISGSHDMLHKLAFGEQKVRFDFADANENIEDVEHNGVNAHLKRMPEIELWARDMYNLLSGKFGEDNVISFVVHCDEQTPHVHAEVLPIKDGKLSYKKVFCGADKYEYRQRTLELHDAFAEVNKNWGLNRGDSITVTHRKHRSTEEYRRELSNQCSTLEREVDEKYATLSKLNGQIRLAETRIKGLQTMISNLESSRDAVEKEIDSIHQKLSSGEVDLEQQHLLARKEESLQKKLDSILFKLEDKRSKLSEADRKLDELHEQLEKAQARHEDLETQIKDANVNVSHIVMNKIGAEALWSVLRDFTTAKPHMTPEEQERFEGSFINEMSRKGVHIIACASLLAMGMIDQATNYAENCGGGGTSCDNNWGKDPEEDERNWLRRCLAKSRAMMKPSARRMKR